MIASAVLGIDLAFPLYVHGSTAAGRWVNRDPQSVRWGPSRRACPHARRTPALYSRNQPRTNRALYKRKGKGGAGQLTELLYVSLKR